MFDIKSSIRSYVSIQQERSSINQDKEYHGHCNNFEVTFVVVSIILRHYWRKCLGVEFSLNIVLTISYDNLFVFSTIQFYCCVYRIEKIVKNI